MATGTEGTVFTSEHSLPVLEAAHIRSYADGGSHDVSNGFLMRSDIHRSFDKGYVTVDEALRFKVSSHLRGDRNNVRIYCELDGKPIGVPATRENRPDANQLTYHRTQVFRAG